MRWCHHVLGISAGALRERQEAENLRSHAALPRLTLEASAALLRSAGWAEQTALYWQAGAEDYRS